VERQYAGTVVDILGWSPQPGRFHPFAVDISHLSFIADDQATGNQHVAAWPRVHPPRHIRHQPGRPRTSARPHRDPLSSESAHDGNEADDR
jgi:hypothetical protein